MKKFISLMLCLLMLVPMLASCSKDEELQTIETATRAAVTLGMYVITGEETTEAAADTVEAAIRALVRSKYTTNLEIEFITEDEYYSIIEARLAKMALGGVETEKVEEETAAVETNDAGEIITGAADEEETEAVTTAATIVNEYGVTELRYPELRENQIDLFMIADYDKYLEYVNNKWLYNLDDTLKNASKKLNDYIYPTILDSAKVGGSYYGIANNMPIGGNSPYIVIDKDLAAEFGLDVSRVDSVDDLKAFLAWVAENKEGVVPFAGEYDKVNATYMNMNGREFTTEFSLVGAYGKKTVADAENLFANANYKKELLALAEMKYAGYVSEADTDNFAVALRTGDINAMAADAENYDIVVLDGASKPANELAGSMFAVSAFTKDFNRVMEVITLLNTSSELRNLLQYGVENVNYELDEETGALSRMNNDYMMDLYKTGNVYMAYPEEGMPLNIWEMAKKQNLVSGTYFEDAFGGFTLPEDTPEEKNEAGEVTKEAFTVDMSTAEALAKASAELKAALDGAATYEEYEALVNGAAEKYADVIASFLNTENANTPYALYKAN